MSLMASETESERGIIRVLHVDDHTDILNLSSIMLQREDDRFTVETATSVEEGRDKLADGPFECIISDFDMPRETGIEFLESVRENYPDMPFILYTGKGSEEIASDAISAGVTDYLQKEAGTAQYTVLANRIRNVVKGYRSQQALTEQQVELKRKARAMDAAPVGITISDPSRDDNPLIYVNDGFTKISGYSAEEVLGSNCRFLQGENTRPEPVARMQKAIADEEPVTVELLNYRKDDTEFWNRVSIAPVRGDDGDVTNYVGFQQQITDQDVRKR